MLSLNLTFNWSQRHGFKFYPSKTMSMHFTLCRCVIPPPSFRMGTSLIHHAVETKFLGLILDSKLYYTAHFKDFLAQFLRSLQLLSCLSHMSWGDRATLLCVYLCITRSRLDYGCQIYGSTSASVLKTLDPIHHRALCLGIGAFCTFPVVSLYAETGEPSLTRDVTSCVYRCIRAILRKPLTPAQCSLTPADYDHYQNHTYQWPHPLWFQDPCSPTDSWWEPTLCDLYARVFLFSLFNGVP